MENTHRCERESMLTGWFHTLFSLSLCSLSGQQFLPPKHFTSVCVCERQGVWANHILLPASINMQEQERNVIFVHVVLMTLMCLMSSFEMMKLRNISSESPTTDYTVCEKLHNGNNERAIKCHYSQTYCNLSAYLL